MGFKKRAILIVFGVVLSMMTLPCIQAWAQEDYPNRPIELIVPFTPGGPLDLSVRYFTDKWPEFLKQPVVVVNKGGASGVLGTKFVANSKPDGYTLAATADSPLIVARLERKDAGYDLDSLRMLFLHSKITTFFSVKGDARWKTMKEFIAEAKANPGKLKYATWGPASASNMAMEMLMESAGIKLTFIPFKSSPDSLAAVAGENADMSVTFALSGMGKSGMIRPLAISDDERLPDYPDLPTLKEVGCPIPYKTQYNGMAAPAKTPEKVIAKFIEAHKKVLAKYEKDLNDKFPRMELYPVYIDGNPMMQYLREREKMYKDFFAKIGFKPE